MKSMSSVIGTVASVLLIGAGAALYFLTPPDLDRQFRTAIGTIQKMQQLGAEWGVETARVRADPSANFDGLAEFVPRMKQMKGALRENLAQIPDLPDRVAADARAYLSAMESLRERVERFKTAYAVIRNSERYLPLSSAELVARAQGAGDRELARAVSLLTQEMSAYLATSNEADRERLSGRIQTLKDEGSGKTSVLASAIANFVAHAEVLLDKQGRTDELFQGITSNILSERVKPLTGSLESEQNERRRSAALHQQGAIALGVGVLLVWVVIGFTRRSPGEKLAEVYAAPTVEPTAPIAPVVSTVTVGREPVVASVSRSEAASPDVDTLDFEAPPGRRVRTGADLIQDLLTTGAMPGLMGQSMGAYTRRMSEDLNAIRRKTGEAGTSEETEEVAQRWRRLLGDTRRLGFFAQRMVVLARHLAPDDRGNIDVNECLDEVLSEAGAGMSCTVERRFEAVPVVAASRTELQLIFATCTDYALHALRDMDSAEAKLEVSTVAAGKRVTISFTHNGGWLPPEQRKNQFVPFYASQDQKAGIELPAALYLAKKYQGSVSIDTLSDDRTTVRVQLPAGTGTA